MGYKYNNFKSIFGFQLWDPKIEVSLKYVQYWYLLSVYVVVQFYS